jgi:protoheme IX farnesyltransferase
MNDKAIRPIWRDYLEMTKPNVVLLMIMTSAIGMFMAVPGMVPVDVLIIGNLGIALMAGSAAAINHLIDYRTDINMKRTENRPVAQGRITPTKALVFAIIIGGLGMWMLMVYINALTAWLTLLSLIGYAFIYTMFLKRATPQNIVIGGLAGAAPPLLGWTAVTNEVHGYGLLLVLIIFAWTPPHFWALAIHRKEDYAKVDIPMLPVTHGDKFTRLQVLLYTIILLIVTMLPFATLMSGPLYAIGALILGLIFLWYAIQLMRDKDDKIPMATFKYSIIYLMLLFVVMLVDHYVYPPLVF